ncbi:hypothetical protein OOZ51_04975 [Arthrobacter sp. MI7-26]|uniref:hypothetical protein n=1 Tax=Arthrobacter sp. MI7-26 TaxID=2993653 RepID=UPI002248F646|nr:hypothetical protein [Arthrobacter sp. MI7-26]MCX2747167.1 hypothetical protein [Arthrobacter sp. MI7-26]
MSTYPEDLEGILPMNEQSELFQGALLAHHYELMGQIQNQLDMIKSTPEGMTPEIATFFENVLDAERQWLESHGIYFPDSSGGGGGGQ